MHPATTRLLVVASAFAAVSMHASVRFTTFTEVRSTLEALAQDLPPPLAGLEGARLEAAWNDWVARHDRDVRGRLRRGDADTLVNWLLLGTSFTSQPRVLADPSPSGGAGAANDSSNPAALVTARARDLVNALTNAGADDRRLFARRFYGDAGFGLGTPAERARLEAHLISEVARVAREQEEHRQGLDAARSLGTGRAAFFARSNLFRDRGVSLDTSLLPNFALEEALRTMRQQRLLTSGGIRRVAIVGPGLDFSDKATGYDFYPQQTVQPFALIDTLDRLGLSGPGLTVTTLDISPRVNDHLSLAREHARRGRPYVLRLPLELGAAWLPAVVAYWQRLGERIGTDVPDDKPPSIGDDLRVRAVSVRPAIVLQMVPLDVNIVTQRTTEPPFDLVVATNVFVYYEAFEQRLALEGIAAMLKPGAFLLANDALPESPASPVRAAGYVTARYSTGSDVADNIVWYRRD